jgi:hypothetical protein
MRKLPLVLLLLSVLCLPAAGVAGCAVGTVDTSRPLEDIMPPGVKTVMDTALEYAVKGGVSLNGKWANWHVELVASGEGRDFAGYEQHLATLQTMRRQTKARYIYILYTNDADASAYILTVDGSTDPEPFGDLYEVTPQMQAAWEGTASADLSAWDDDKNDLCWTAYAPIYDGNSEIVAILGIDLAAPAILNYPEWNRDHRRWNGLVSLPNNTR